MRKILRRKQTGIPVSTAFDWQQQGLYPRFFKIGIKASGLFEDEHDRVMALRSADASQEKVRELVSAIHSERLKIAEQVMEERVVL